MKSRDPETQNEIIIVRRSYDNDEEGHSSDVWKIVYADLMTAMMIFFLIMWLINVIDNDKKVAIANYFNPIQLIEFESGPRGIDDLESKMKSDQKPQSEVAQETADNSAQMTEAHAPEEESGMMGLPYQVPNLITQTKSGSANAGMQKDSVKATQHRNPFNPEYWNADIPSDAILSLDQIAMQDEENKNAEEKNKQTETAAVSPQMSIAQKEESVETKHSTDKEDNAAEFAKNILSDISALIKDEIRVNYPEVHVNLVDNGIVIELTDSQNYGMFAVGSAKPDKQLIVLLDGIAKIIQKYEGRIIISGHTDARPYKGGHYDNWQLSAARAQAAYYALVHSGFDESRILRVESYADRNLKNSEDSYADENRRITIFLQLPKAKMP
ncbi:MAG: chemotaxis protein MotB [Candidatus Tokpelaia sp. JSC189]|nr:MAG: chemotaxis protein MotB [Candidatus Tokpelaia sp. JSC189]